MTPEERSNPNVLNPSRKKRIADGAGVPLAEVNKLCKQFEQARKMMKQMSGMMGKKRWSKRRHETSFFTIDDFVIPHF
jgi:signal recognition particle subunit SRP54